MRVLGVDPGSRFLGYGLVEQTRGKAAHIAHGVVKAGETQPLATRLQTIFEELKIVIHLYKPTAVAVEGVFTHKNARSALILGHARGVALLLAAQAGLPVFEYAPAKVKRSVGAGGNDQKDAVSRMVCRILQLDRDTMRADAWDALAVALCHLSHARFGVAPVSNVVRASGGRRAAMVSFAERLSPSYRKVAAG